MRVHWRDDWPVITREDELIPYVAPRPDLPAQSASAIPLTGNFTVRDEFDGPLPHYWMTMRVPGESWYDLKHTPGAVTIRARPASIGGFVQPSYLGRRQQHAHATVTAAMRYDLRNPGDRAGLIALQNDEYYYFFGVQRLEADIQLVLASRAGSAEPIDGRIIKAQSLRVTPGSPLELRIKARGSEYDFEYRLPESDWRVFAAKQDGTLLSTEVAQGFVGVTLGMYAYTPEAGVNGGMSP
jgi:alpha-N-arabinofuranosidase